MTRILQGSRPGGTGHLASFSRSAVDQELVDHTTGVARNSLFGESERQNSSDNEDHTHGDVLQKLSARCLRDVALQAGNPRRTRNMREA
jgi:hypothetical protein